jgi:hypothetical protein
MEVGTVLFGEERFHYTTISGTHTRKRLELTKLTGPPIEAASFFMVLAGDKAGVAQLSHQWIFRNVCPSCYSNGKAKASKFPSA